MHQTQALALQTSFKVRRGHLGSHLELGRGLLGFTNPPPFDITRVIILVHDIILCVILF